MEPDIGRPLRSDLRVCVSYKTSVVLVWRGHRPPPELPVFDSAGTHPILCQDYYKVSTDTSYYNAILLSLSGNDLNL